MKRCIVICALLLLVISCKKETDPNCVAWIVTDAWLNAKGESLQDYNRQYGFSEHDLKVCGVAKDTVYQGKKVILRTMNDTAFYVREYMVNKYLNDD